MTSLWVRSIELSSQLGLAASLIQFKCTRYFHEIFSWRLNACLWGRAMFQFYFRDKKNQIHTTGIGTRMSRIFGFLEKQLENLRILNYLFPTGYRKVLFASMTWRFIKIYRQKRFSQAKWRDWNLSLIKDRKFWHREFWNTFRTH